MDVSSDNRGWDPEEENDRDDVMGDHAATPAIIASDPPRAHPLRDVPALENLGVIARRSSVGRGGLPSHKVG
jgi:hypothetical protein